MVARPRGLIHWTVNRGPAKGWNSGTTDVARSELERGPSGGYVRSRELAVQASDVRHSRLVPTSRRRVEKLGTVTVPVGPAGQPHDGEHGENRSDI